MSWVQFPSGLEFYGPNGDWLFLLVDESEPYYLRVVACDGSEDGPAVLLTQREIAPVVDVIGDLWEVWEQVPASDYADGVLFCFELGGELFLDVCKDHRGELVLRLDVTDDDERMLVDFDVDQVPVIRAAFDVMAEDVVSRRPRRTAWWRRSRR